MAGCNSIRVNQPQGETTKPDLGQKFFVFHCRYAAAEMPV